MSEYTNLKDLISDTGVYQVLIKKIGKEYTKEFNGKITKTKLISFDYNGQNATEFVKEKDFNKMVEGKKVLVKKEYYKGSPYLSYEVFGDDIQSTIKPYTTELDRNKKDFIRESKIQLFALMKCYPNEDLNKLWDRLDSLNEFVGEKANYKFTEQEEEANNLDLGLPPF